MMQKKKTDDILYFTILLKEIRVLFNPSTHFIIFIELLHVLQQDTEKLGILISNFKLHSTLCVYAVTICRPVMDFPVMAHQPHPVYEKTCVFF